MLRKGDQVLALVLLGLPTIEAADETAFLERPVNFVRRSGVEGNAQHADRETFDDRRFGLDGRQPPPDLPTVRRLMDDRIILNRIYRGWIAWVQKDRIDTGSLDRQVHVSPSVVPVPANNRKQPKVIAKTVANLMPTLFRRCQSIQTGRQRTH